MSEVTLYSGCEGLDLSHVKCRGTSPIRKRLLPGRYGRPVPRALWWS